MVGEITKADSDHRNLELRYRKNVISVFGNKKEPIRVAKYYDKLSKSPFMPELKLEDKGLLNEA